MSGVSRVQVYGAQKYAVRVQVDPDGFWFKIPLELQQKVWPTEDFELVRSLVDSPVPESDLFAGVRAALAAPERSVEKGGDDPAKTKE